MITKKIIHKSNNYAGRGSDEVESIQFLNLRTPCLSGARPLNRTFRLIRSHIRSVNIKVRIYKFNEGLPSEIVMFKLIL